MDLAQIRKDYALQNLDIDDVDANPFLQFQKWMDEAIKAAIIEPTAMHLATVSKEGKPSGRIVLLKGTENECFIFFTNYQSQKGQELAENPFVSLTFFWAELERQVRIEGKIEKISEEASNAYFQTRPRASQIGALASPQSEWVADRAFLENRFTALEKEYEGKPIPKPANWGGYSVIPDRFEFWQGRRSRLHDRIQYKLINAEWDVCRLAP